MAIEVLVSEEHAPAPDSQTCSILSPDPGRLAGGAKRLLLEQAIDSAPSGGLALELGSYVGYSATVLGPPTFIT